MDVDLRLFLEKFGCFGFDLEIFWLELVFWGVFILSCCFFLGFLCLFGFCFKYMFNLFFVVGYVDFLFFFVK